MRQEARRTRCTWTMNRIGDITSVAASGCQMRETDFHAQISQRSDGLLASPPTPMDRKSLLTVADAARIAALRKCDARSGPAIQARDAKAEDDYAAAKLRGSRTADPPTKSATQP